MVAARGRRRALQKAQVPRSAAGRLPLCTVACVAIAAPKCQTPFVVHLPPLRSLIRLSPDGALFARASLPFANQPPPRFDDGKPPAHRRNTPHSAVTSASLIAPRYVADILRVAAAAIRRKDCRAQAMRSTTTVYASPNTTRSARGVRVMLMLEPRVAAPNQPPCYGNIVCRVLPARGAATAAADAATSNLILSPRCPCRRPSRNTINAKAKHQAGMVSAKRRGRADKGAAVIEQWRERNDCAAVQQYGG